MQDKRKYPRFSISLDTDLVMKDLKGTFVANTKDFSRGGMGIVLDYAIPCKEQEVQLILHLEECPHPVEVKGAIVWTQVKDNRQQVGIEIHDIDKAIKGEILDRAFQTWREEQKKEMLKSSGDKGSL